MRSEYSPIRQKNNNNDNNDNNDNFILYKYDKMNEKNIFMVKPYICIIIAIFGTLSFAFILKNLNF
tara:strand:- start:526 stop:723 length:198 start_codon:yes stop_codon:yes gene_type:complete